MLEPAFGDEVLVRPSEPKHPVQEHANIFGRFMPNEWTARVWDEWLHRRFKDGSIQFKHETSLELYHDQDKE